MTTTLLNHLSTLVSQDTRNPPRNIQTTDPVFDYLSQTLDGCNLHMWDYGEGCIAFFATRGEPKTVFNFHLDTVPSSDRWTRDPFELQVVDDKAYGLGSCDIKGALACFLDVVTQCTSDFGLLVTTDEEAGNSTAVNSFLSRNNNEPQLDQVIVAEPTQCRAVTAHRGVVTALMEFTGIAGHASEIRAIKDNAIHQAFAWGQAALNQVNHWSDLHYENLSGVRFNVGTIEGGIKPNMIAPSATVKVGLRTLPGQSGDQLVQTLAELGDPKHLTGSTLLMELPPLPHDKASADQKQKNLKLAASLPAEKGEAVDFWTEAALFSRAGLATVVLGSGDIAQAHIADEWVALEQLQQLKQIYEALIHHGC